MFPFFSGGMKTGWFLYDCHITDVPNCRGGQCAPRQGGDYSAPGQGGDHGAPRQGGKSQWGLS